jgi:hypothetical protein
MRFWGTILLLGMPAILLASQPPIYKSTDERGRVTYSTEPAQDAVEVERIQVEAPPPDAAEHSGDRTQQMMDVARDFEESRLEIEKLREERRAREKQLALEMEQFKRQQALLDQVGRRYNYGVFWPYRPIPIPPRPEHPIEPPQPVLPPSRIGGGGHSGISLPIHRGVGQ